MRAVFRVIVVCEGGAERFEGDVVDGSDVQLRLEALAKSGAVDKVVDTDAPVSVVYRVPQRIARRVL